MPDGDVFITVPTRVEPFQFFPPSDAERQMIIIVLGTGRMHTGSDAPTVKKT